MAGHTFLVIGTFFPLSIPRKQNCCLKAALESLYYHFSEPNIKMLPGSAVSVKPSSDENGYAQTKLQFSEKGKCGRRISKQYHYQSNFLLSAQRHFIEVWKTWSPLFFSLFLF